MTRIVAGTAGGRRIAVPPGSATRPTAERAREGLFSALEAGYGGLAGSSFLDLYAGSGAVGLEAASRGAHPVVLVERDPSALRTLRSNVAALGIPDVEVRAADALRLLDAPAVAAFRIVFVDPPYAMPVDRCLRRLVDNGWLTADATVVVERASRDAPLTWPDGLVADRSRKYGDSTLWYGRRP